MSYDPHALKLYIDGSAYDNPGGTGGIACFAEYPEERNKAPELIFDDGFYETRNNRAELIACIRAFQYVSENCDGFGVERVQIITDSKYVFDNRSRAATWRRNKWTNLYGRPMENSDLWKKYLSVCGRPRIRTDVVWSKGKKTFILKAVDKAAKKAANLPTKQDRGHRTGKVGRSKIKGGASSLFPASGQIEFIRVYRSALLRKIHHKVYFDLFEPKVRQFTQKHTAYCQLEIVTELHRGNTYRVRFNNETKNPQIMEILEALALSNKLDAPISTT